MQEHTSSNNPVLKHITFMVTVQNGIGQNGTDKMVAMLIDFNSNELNLYLVTTSYK